MTEYNMADPALMWPVLETASNHTADIKFPTEVAALAQVRIAESQAKARERVASLEQGVSEALEKYSKAYAARVRAERALQAAQENQYPGSDLTVDKARKAAVEAEAAQVVAERTARNEVGAFANQVAATGNFKLEQQFKEAADAVLNPPIDPETKKPIPRPYQTELANFAVLKAQVTEATRIVAEDEKASKGMVEEATKAATAEQVRVRTKRKNLGEAIQQLKSLRAGMESWEAKRRKLVAKQEAAEAKLTAAKEEAKANKGASADKLAELTALVDKAEADRAKAIEAIDVHAVTGGDLNTELLVKLNRVASLAPDNSPQSRLIKELATEIRAAHLEQSMDTFSRRLREKVGSLKQAGASVSTAVDITAGVAAGVVLTGELRVMQNLTYTVSRGSDGKYKATISDSTKVRVRGSADVGLELKGTLDAGRFGSQSWEYDTLEELIENAGTTVLLSGAIHADSTQNKPEGTAKGPAVDPVERKRLRVEARQQRDRLTKRLVLIGAMKPTDNLSEVGPVESTETKTLVAGGSVELSGKVGINAGRVGAGVQAGAEYAGSQERRFKRIGYLDEIVKDKVLGQLAEFESPEIFGFEDFDLDGNRIHRKGQDAIDARARIDAEINRSRNAIRSLEQARDAEIADLGDSAPVKEVSEIRKNYASMISPIQELVDIRTTNLSRSIEQLKIEYEGFVELTNQIRSHALDVDGSFGIRRPATDAVGQQGRFLKARGLLAETMKARKIKTKEAAQYIRAITQQYAALTSTYHSGFEEGKVPKSMKQQLRVFEDELRVPKVELKQDKLLKYLSYEATQRIKHVYSLQGKIEVTGKYGPGRRKLGVTVTSLGERRDGDTDTTWGMKITFDQGSDFISDNVIAQVFTLKNMQKHVKDGAKNDKGEDTDISALTTDIKSAFKQLASVNPVNSSDGVTLSLVRKNNSWRLKTVDSTISDARSSALMGKFKTGLGFDIVGSAREKNTRKMITGRYYGANTLSAITDAYRERHVAQDDDLSDEEKDKAWNTFLKDSHILDRMMDQLDADAKRNEEARKSGKLPKDAASFAELLDRIEANAVERSGGDLVQVRKPLKSIGPAFFRGTGAGGVINEVGEWLLKLNDSDEQADRDAAAAFIKAFKTPAKNVEERLQRGVLLSSAMNGLVKRKTEQEDADSNWIVKHEVKGDAIRNYVYNQIETTRKQLTKSLKSKPKSTSLSDLKDAAALQFRLSRVRAGAAQRAEAEAEKKLKLKKEDGASAKAISDAEAELGAAKKTAAEERRAVTKDFDVFKQVHALEYAGETFEDLVEFDDEEDKNTALGLLGSDLRKMLSAKEARVYLGDRMDGELTYDFDTDQVGLSAKIKKGKETSMSPDDVAQPVDEVIAKLRDHLKGDVKKQQITYEPMYGTSSKDYDPKNPPYDEGTRKKHIKRVVASAPLLKSIEVKNLMKSTYRHRPVNQSFGEAFKKWTEEREKQKAKKRATELNNQKKLSTASSN